MDTIAQVTDKASWEQLLELHAAMYAVISRNRYEKDRLGLLRSLQQVASRWSLDNCLA
jgi:hypothetical protein